MRVRRVMLTVIEECNECRFCFDSACIHEGRRKSTPKGAKTYGGRPNGVHPYERPPTWCPWPRESDVPL